MSFFNIEFFQERDNSAWKLSHFLDSKSKQHIDVRQNKTADNFSDSTTTITTKNTFSFNLTTTIFPVFYLPGTAKLVSYHLLLGLAKFPKTNGSQRFGRD